MLTRNDSTRTRTDGALTGWSTRLCIALALVLAFTVTDATPSTAAAGAVITADAPSSTDYGSPVSVRFSTTVADGESAAVEYLSASTWKRSSIATTVSGGNGTLSWTPSSDRTYRVSAAGTSSDEFTITVVASLQASAPASIAQGATLNTSFTTTLGAGTQVTVYYKSGDSWVRSSVATAVSGGTGTVSWRPSAERTYRLQSGSTVSTPFTVAVDAKVTVSAPSWIKPGETATLQVSTSPDRTGSMALYYRTGSGDWTRSAIVISVENGSGTVSWKPSSTREYSVASHWSKSEQFKISVLSKDINGAIVDAALTQVGYEEPSWRNNKFNTWIGDNNAWCSVFVSWSASKAGFADVIPQRSSFESFKSAIESKGVLRSDSTLPGPGAMVLFDWGSSYGPSHLGIVVSRSGNTLYTVEGNTTDGSGDPQRGVYRRARHMSSVWKWFYPSDL